MFENLDKDAKAGWLEALRSGSYEQTRGKLKGDDGHCCLGVLCETLGIDNFMNSEDEYVFTAYQWLLDHNTDDSVTYDNDDDGCSHALQLPDPLAFHLGLDTRELDLLMSLNDGTHDKSVGNGEGKRYTFKEIADLIESGIWDDLSDNRERWSE